MSCWRWPAPAGSPIPRCSSSRRAGCWPIRVRSAGRQLAGQWLLLRQLDDVSPATKEFDGNLRYAFQRETELLFETILREDRSVLDLLDADYTFVDERLARHYGIPNIRGSRFRRVALRRRCPRAGCSVTAAS